MGTQQESIRQKLTSRSTLVTWFLAPAILAGIALLGFQTYSLITGKSFSDLDFGIGKLWATEETDLFIQTDNTQSNFVRTIQRELAAKPVVARKVTTTEVPTIRKKSAVLVRDNTVAGVIQSDKIEELFSQETIQAASISANFGSKQIKKYVDRLQNEYLINPGLVPQQGKWYIGVSFAPGLSYRRFTYNSALMPGTARDGNTQYTFGLTEQDRNVTDRAITSYAIGLDFGKRLSARLSLFSGVHYAKYGEQIRVQVADKQNPNYEMSSFMGTSPHYERESDEKRESLPYSNKYSYVEVPLGLSYTIKEYSKSKIAVNTAIVLQRLDRVNALVYDFGTDYYYWMNTKEEIFREYGVGGNISISFSQYVGERFEVFAAPQFRYNLSSTFQTPYPVTQNQYTTGIQVGFKQQLF